jgi:high-affinity iron transporter
VNRELLEGILSLLAAGVLFYVSYWLISKSDVRRWTHYLRSRVEHSVGHPGERWTIFGIAFLAVYREAFETVLFYQALLLDVEGHELWVLGGTLTAGVALGLSVYLIFHLGKRQPLPRRCRGLNATIPIRIVHVSGVIRHVYTNA